MNPVSPKQQDSNRMSVLGGLSQLFNDEVSFDRAFKDSVIKSNDYQQQVSTNSRPRQYSGEADDEP
jgi:hypothetical protein